MDNLDHLAPLDRADLAVAISLGGITSQNSIARWYREGGRAVPPVARLRALVTAIRASGPTPASPLRAVLDAFALEIRRSARAAFEKSKFAEETGRTLLQFYLLPRGYAEARSGAGFTDIVVVGKDAVIETKMCSSETAFNRGVAQLADYLESDRSSQSAPRGYLVVFVKGDPPPWLRNLSSPIVEKGHLIDLVIASIPMVAPSQRKRTVIAKARP